MSPERDLTADCASCVGLCCVVLRFARSAEFAFDKPAGTPCRHLTPDSRCSIHDRLWDSGFPGCVAYDCFGAGQRVTQETFGDRALHGDALRGAEVAAAFATVRALHELLVLVRLAQAVDGAAVLHPQLRACAEHLDRVAAGSSARLGQVDLGEQRRRVGALLTRVVRRARRAAGEPLGCGVTGPIRPGADLVGARLHGADLTGADLAGAVLVGADLSDAGLRLADLRGADLRGADLTGADLSAALLLTQPQVSAAHGDARTRLPVHLQRPGHWRKQHA